MMNASDYLDAGLEFVGQMPAMPLGPRAAAAAMNALAVERSPDNFEEVTDYVEIAKYGVASTPGIVIDGKVVHVGGLPRPDDVAKWLAA